MQEHPQPGWKPKHTWIAIDRADPEKRPPANRLADFRRVEIPYDESTASAQAARCIQCGVPTCIAACPLGTPLNELLGLTADQQFREAAELLFSSQYIPEIASHTCIGGRRCEAVCVLNSKTGPVPIRSITRFLLEYGWQHGLAEPAIEPARKQRVAVLGSGICGLVAADAISRRGYEVTVFDSRQHPGGRMMNGLPGFRVDKDLVTRRVELLSRRGVHFRMNVSFENEVRLAALRREFDAVFLGFGREDGLPLEIPGAHLNGVLQACAFVSEWTETDPAPIEPRVPDVRGRKVVVLGGGDTAMDAVRIAIRRGASEAICVYRRDEASMPADVDEYTNAFEEGARFVFLTQPVEVIGNSAGQVVGLHCVRTEPVESTDILRRSVRAVAGTEFVIDADQILVAYGFKAGRLPQSEDFGKISVDENGRVRVGPDRMTNLPGVFAGGSIVGGSPALSDAVRDAREAAAAIHRYVQER